MRVHQGDADLAVAAPAVKGCGIAHVLLLKLPPRNPRNDTAPNQPMPTYEYRCSDCGREFELFQRMSDTPGASCPDCGRRAERLISGGAGLLFKGEGFYITDHRSDAYRKSAREESGAGADKESVAGSKGKAGAGKTAADAGSGAGGSSGPGGD